MSAAIPQLAFDLRIPTHRPLLPMKAAMVFLDRSEDDVLALIEGRGLGFAWDIARPGRKRYVVVWRGSCLAYRYEDSGDQNLSLGEVVDLILPKRTSLRAVEVKSIFSVNQGHIANLIADGLLEVDRARPVKAGYAQSPWITRPSCVRLLTERRMT